MAGVEQNQDETGLMTQINITPFVDVVLVLLVIFMVTAPLIAKDYLQLNLPKSSETDGQTTVTLSIAVNKEGDIILNGVLVDEAQFIESVKTTVQQNPDLQGIVAADKDVVYGKVVRVIELLKQNGLQKFAIQIEKQE